MSKFFNEVEADAEVINNLIKEIHKLRSEIMSKYIKEIDGTILKVTQFEVVSQEELLAKIDRLEKKLVELNELLPQTATPEATPEPTPEVAPEPITVTSETPTEPEATPAEPTAVDQPTPDQPPVIQ